MEKSSWSFEKSDYGLFDTHIRNHIPLYDVLHEQIKQISTWYIEPHTNIYDLGTSTGEIIKNLLDNDKGNRFIGIDNSQRMLSICKERITNENVEFLLKDLTKYNDFNNASVVVSMLTLQFISLKYRKEIIKNIYEGLNHGGVFLFVEKVIGSNHRFNEMFVEMYHDMKLENGVTKEEIYDKTRMIRGVLKPLTVEENYNLLSEAGFKEVDMFFKWNNFAGFIAIK